MIGNHKKQTALTQTIIVTVIAIASVLSLSGCSTISVKSQDPAQQLVKQRENVITSNKLSSNTYSSLHTAGLDEQTCFNNFSDCLTQIKNSQYTTTYNPRQLSILAELHYDHALKITKKKQCKTLFNSNGQMIAPAINHRQACIIDYQNNLLNAIRYSYAYLFFDQLTGQDYKKAKLANDLDFQTQDIYNAASNNIIENLYKSTNEKQFINNVGKQTNGNQQYQLMRRKIADNQLNIFVPNDEKLTSSSFNKAGSYTDIEQLIPTASLKLSGLNTISKRAGIGTSYLAQLHGRQKTSVFNELQSSNNSQPKHETDDPHTRIYPTGNLLLTSVILPTGTNLDSVLSTHSFNIHLYNPFNTKTVNILGDEYPLAANFTASYASWLVENQLSQVGYLSMLYQKQHQSLPRLFMLEPYNPDKRIIIMMHGLASSPKTWVGLTNDILNDAKLQESYQVWQVFYPTNMPMLETRFQVQRLIAAAYELVDANHTTIAGQNSVIIGHSMGGVIARMMLSDNDLSKNFNDLINSPNDPEAIQNDDLNNFLLNIYHQPSLEGRFKLNAIPQIDTAIFISSPHKGTKFADLWFTKALRKIIKLPAEIVKFDIGDDEQKVSNSPLGALLLRNGASQLSDKSAFMQLTSNIKINSKISYHSIMGNAKDELVSRLEVFEENQSSDGIVPYKSAHLAGAQSETIIAGGHDIHTNPKTVVVLRKILHTHLKKHPINK